MSNYSGLGARCGNEELSSPQGNGTTGRVITAGKRHEACEQDNFGDAADSEAHQFPACDNTGCAWKPVKNNFMYRFIKRLFDIFFSLAVIIIGLIPGIILGVFVAVDTKAAPLYGQTRIGKNGKPFRILKFRTMVSDSDDVEKYFTPDQLEMWNREHKVDNDPRITKLGKLLRKLSLDEFPQFINVILGEISVIGPRAITEPELEHYGSQKDLLLSVPPGITGLWQIGDRNMATYENGTRQAIELDYVRRASLGVDCAIFLGTFSAMFIKRSGK